MTLLWRSFLKSFLDELPDTVMEGLPETIMEELHDIIAEELHNTVKIICTWTLSAQAFCPPDGFRTTVENSARVNDSKRKHRMV